MDAIFLGNAGAMKRLRIPLFLDRVSAGFPSPAQDYIERTLDLNELCIPRPAATYFVRAVNYSMIDVGIFPDDVLVVDRSLDPVHGDIVVAALDGELTVKQLEMYPRPRLIPRNKKYAPIELSEGTELEIQGVVLNGIRWLRRK